MFSYIIVLVIKLQICTSNCYKLYLLERFNINNKTLNFIEDCLKLIETNTNRVFEYIANNPGCTFERAKKELYFSVGTI